ncbi:hypothetical protein [Brevundimonas sp. TSRC1-1]|uniref:hypothetical protein n=1 Tax=Brevundimonas sp. TSRC1-1 TaxID=2804562 RepID=UPI003CEC25B4
MKFEYETEVMGANRAPGRHEGPSFSAYETPESRVPRLGETYGYARETVRRLSVEYQNAFDTAVLQLHDYKGTLQITWRDHESRVMFGGVMAGAWEHNGEHMVEHHLAETA